MKKEIKDPKKGFKIVSEGWIRPIQGDEIADIFVDKKIESWEEEFDALLSNSLIDYYSSQIGGFVPEHYREKLKFFIRSLLAQQRQELIEGIDKIYKKEKGIHNWLDLKSKLNENRISQKTEQEILGEET